MPRTVGQREICNDMHVILINQSQLNKFAIVTITMYRPSRRELLVIVFTR